MVGRFCDFLEDFCSRAEIPGEERDESEWLQLPTSDIRMVVKEVLSIQEENLLYQVPVDFLVRLLKVLDHQIHRAEGLSIDESENVSQSLFDSTHQLEVEGSEGTFSPARRILLSYVTRTRVPCLTWVRVQVSDSAIF